MVASVYDTLAFFTEIDEVFLRLNDLAARVINKIIFGDEFSFQIQVIRSKLNQIENINFQNIKETGDARKGFALS